MTTSAHPPSSPADPHRSPLAAVLAAFQGGAASVAEVRLRTGLDHDVVDAAVEHLVRMGRLERSAVDLGCVGDGCDSCPASGVGAGCDTAGRHRRGRRSGEAVAADEVVTSRRLSGLHLRS